MKEKINKSPGRTSRPDWCEAAGLALTALLRRLEPPEAARDHFETARLEMLKGLRALVDARIDHLSKSRRKGEKIQVE